MTSDSLNPRSSYAHVDDVDESLASTPLRSASPLVIEEDEGLTNFFQQEAHGVDVISPFLDSAQDPILYNSAGSIDHVDQELDSLRSQGIHKAYHRPRLTPFVAILTATACISGLLFGYDTGVISGTLVSIGTDLGGSELSVLAQSLITSSTSLFALIASPPGGWCADVYGRRWVIMAADLLFIAGALVQAFCGSVWLMVVGRSVVGAGVGVASLVTPLYISELVPPEYRGRLVATNNAFITGGQMVAYVVGFWLSGLSHGWRWMVGLGAVPALVQVMLLTLLPETPRWLIKVGRVEPARVILNKVYGMGSERAVDGLVRVIEREVMEEEEARRLSAQLHQRKGGNSGVSGWRPEGWTALFGIGGHRRALAIACMLQALQQLCGFNVLMYFSATIFRSVGFHSPILASLSVAVTNFLFTLVAILVIDKLGRRRILLLTVPFMVVALLFTALGFRFITSLPTDASKSAGPAARATMIALFSRADTDGSASGWSFGQVASDDGGSKAWSTVILVSIIAYVAFFAMGLGSVPWQQSELFPLSVRSLGCGLSTATNWGSNFAVGLTFLPMMQLLTPSITFMLYATVCAVGWLAVARIYPETKGLGLEEVGGLLKDGWGVEESLRRTRGKS